MPVVREMCLSYTDPLAEGIPEVGSRWKDPESYAEAVVVAVVPPGPDEPGDTRAMVDIEYTAAVESWNATPVKGRERMPVEVLVHSWHEFVPTVWQRLGAG